MLNTLPAVVGAFVLSSGLIVWAGVRLSRYGDIIAQKTGLGGTWIGLILLSTVTSLPEVATGASAVVLFVLPDIAAGDVIGSCLFNLVVLAMLDLRHAEPLSARIHQGHVLTASFGVVLMGLLALTLQLGARVPVVGWIGLPSLGFIALYALAARTIFVFERGRVRMVTEEIIGEPRPGDLSLRQAALRFAGAAAVLVGAATLLPAAAEQLSVFTGLGQSFVGSLFVATSTSLPEVVVSAAAARIGALDMAAANLFGSNLFNIAVMGLDDVMYVRGPITADVSPDHLLTLTAAMVMTGIAIIGLTFRAQKKRFRLSWDAMAIVAVYVLSLGLLAGRG
jgi:cation:H+ antiporter